MATNWRLDFVRQIEREKQKETGLHLVREKMSYSLKDLHFLKQMNFGKGTHLENWMPIDLLMRLGKARHSETEMHLGKVRHWLMKRGILISRQNQKDFDLLTVKTMLMATEKRKS
jgi:hypothetical protein